MGIENLNQNQENAVEITETNDKKFGGFINEKGEFVREKDADTENLKGYVNEKGEFVRGKSIQETKSEDDDELPVHLL